MCTKAPKAPEAPPPPPPPETEVSKGTDTGAYSDQERRRRAALIGRGAGGTILTGPLGVTGSATTSKSVLG